MGVKLIILLALIVGALYCIHLLAQDYQSIRNPARLLFKRHINSSNNMKSRVRWKKILQHDPLTCARLLFCELGGGGGTNHSELRDGFVYMIGLEPWSYEERAAYDVVREAFSAGARSRQLGGAGGPGRVCREKYFLCPFQAMALLDLVDFLIRNKLL